MEVFNKSTAYHNHFIYHNLKDSVFVKCRLDGSSVQCRCSDISLGGIGIVCDEFFPIGANLEIEIDFSLLAEEIFSNNTRIKAKVIGNYDMGSEKLNGMALQLDRESFYELRKVNNHLTSKLSSDEIFAILEESGIRKNDML